MPARPTLALLLTALLLRLGLVVWAPGEPTGDGFFYHVHAVDLLQGNGYVNVDRSPANTWMPGWPAFLAAVYAVFGVHPKAAMALNALLAACTALLVTRLGRALFGPRVGWLAGGLYAVWPGLIYYSATLFNETLFSFLVALLLNLARDAAHAKAHRALRFAATGFTLGACAWVKAEPLLLGVSLAAYFATVAGDRRRLARETALCLGLAILVVLPWTIRNYVVFDRLIPTAAGGGGVLAAANHPGASGGNDLVFLLQYAKRLGVGDATQAEQNLAMNDHAWGEVARFACESPGEQLRIMGSKLRLTYGGDSEGAALIRGHFGRENWHLSEATWRRLARVADVWWWLLAPFFLLGLSRVHAWPPATRVLVLGPLLTWLLLHLVFMGGMRFHVPELVLHALVVAVGIDWLATRVAWSPPDGEAGDA